ncbi:MAG TPA: ABC transporter substrate-binding protein [Aliidongia sp.]|uniref:ABC transporter substrate-binding protein n=1 Tax=Aliidongia sp. TaxID=1914230 RepID=UPI002DDD5B5B|nr:ABC transporter substrate-binding protein [Aliidongia sp.]HEV2677376.1 ABC transporter substrate-binding protein [Aliidongia sp.]
MPRSIHAFTAAAGSAMLAAMLATSAFAADPLRIGVPTDLSGPYATLGEEVMRAVRFATDEANAQHGIAGHMVEFKSYDTEAKPDLARRQSEKLVSEGYTILTGTIASGEGLAIAPLMDRWGSIYISTINKADELTGANCVPRVFRVNTQSAMDAATVKPWLAQRKEKKWAVVAADIAWGRGSGDLFDKAAKGMGKEMVADLYTPADVNDFAPYIEQIKKSGAEGVWVVLAGRDAINFAQQAKQFGLTSSVTVAGVSFTTDGTVKTLGDAAQGIYGIINYSSTLDTPENKTFVKAWTAKYNTPPTNFEGETYLGMQVLFQAVKTANSVKPDDVAKAMSGGEFDTIMGKLKLRAEDHQLLKPNYFGVVEKVDGVLRPVVKTTVSAADVAPAVTCKMPG